MKAPAALLTALTVLAAACTSDPAREAPDRHALIPADAVKMTPETDPVPPVLHSNDWAQPVPLPDSVNTAGAEDSPFITPDGATLYFFFTPDLTIPAEEQLTDGTTGIWVSRRGPGGWEEPERVWLSDPGEDTLDGCGFVLDDVMWFCSARAGNLRTVDFYTARLVDGTWSAWENAGERLNLDYLVGELHLSADGSQIYYHSTRDGGRGGIDIWVTRMEDGAWQEPENVAAVNSEGPDGWPFLSPDGSELWLTRLHEGSPALFRSTLVEGEWSPPEMIVSGFAGEASVDSAGDLYFVHHYHDGTLLEADIYVARRN
jgi:hypothetical protein